MANFPGVEYLQPLHLTLDPEQPKRSVTVAAAVPARGTTRTGEHVAAEPHAASSLDDVISALKSVDFAGMSPADWLGRIDKLQEACARFMTAYLKAGLLATRRSTPQNPEGKLCPQPAVQLLTGNTKLKAWGA